MYKTNRVVGRSVRSTLEIINLFVGSKENQVTNRMNEENGNIEGRIRDIRILNNQSLHPIFPVLSHFPFVGACGVLELYDLFTVGILHLFHLKPSSSEPWKDGEAERLRQGLMGRERSIQ